MKSTLDPDIRVSRGMVHSVLHESKPGVTFIAQTTEMRHHLYMTEVTDLEYWRTMHSSNWTGQQNTCNSYYNSVVNLDEREI